MGTFFKTLLVAAIVFHFLTGTARAWKEETETNQTRTQAYILQLKSGENPGAIERPILKRAKTWQAKKIRRQLIEAMNQAEQYARDGRQERIEIPKEIKGTNKPKSVYTYKGY